MSNGTVQNPYDFIMNPQQPVKPSKNPLKTLSNPGMSLKVKMGLIIGGAVGLVILIGIVGVLLSGGGGDKAKLIGLAQTQQLIITISGDASRNVRSQALKNSAQTTSLSLKTQQRTYLAFLGNNGIKVGEKQLAQKVTTDISTQLKNAQTSSSYDSTYKTLISQALANYSSEIQSLHDSSAAGPQLKAMLEEDSADVKLLTAQLAIPDVTVSEEPGSN